MARQIVVASRLKDGAVVYLRADSGWSELVADGHVVEQDIDAKAILKVAEDAAARQLVVDPYLVDVVGENGTRMPSRLRERIRARGPTVREDLGQQNETDG